MRANPGPHDGGSTAAIFAPDGTATVKAFSPTFYEELDRDFAGFAGHLLIQRYTFATPWPTWERHPAGDEYVYLLSGDTDFVLWRDGREQVIRVATPGSYVIVPRGVWHTARPHAPTTMLFVTPGEGTQNEPTPPA